MRVRKNLIVLALAFAAAGAAGAQASAPPKASQLTYRYQGGGFTGLETHTVDETHGWYQISRQHGPLTSGDGFDGTVPWMRDVSGTVTPETGGDRARLAVNAAYRNARLWRSPGYGGAAVEPLGGGPTGRGLRITPRGGLAFEAWLDEAGDLAVVREDRGFTHVTVTYRDYRRAGRASVAGHVETDPGQGPAAVEVLDLTNVREEPAPPRRAYARRPSAPHDWTLPASGAVTVPMRLMNNHVYVDVGVNGQGPYPFILDTGGHDIVTPSTAAALRLPAAGSVVTGGAGAGTATAGYVHLDSLAVGALQLRNQTVLQLDFSATPVEGLQVGGMLGFEVLRRFVVRIDYGAGTVTFIDPVRFGRSEAQAAGDPVPFVFYDHMPQIDGRVGDVPARMNIDTGARSEVVLTSPFVSRARLRARWPAAVLATDGWGVGGPTKSRMVRLPSMELGRARVTAPVAALSAQEHGSLSDPTYDANVGSGALKRFVVTFDYSRRMMYLKRLTPPPPDAGTFDRLGAWINLAPDGFIVTDVTAGSPAAEAGLRKDDVITRIDGQGAPDLTLPAARLRLRSRPDDVRLIVRRAGGDTPLQVTLRDIVPGA